MQIPALSYNAIIIAILVGVGLYGLMAGKQRLRVLILSVYVGIVLSDQMGPVVATYLTMLSREQISLLLLGLPIVLLGITGGSHAKHHARGAAVGNIIVGMLAGALIVSSALHLLPTSQMADINNDSFIAMHIQQVHLWILGLLPAIALAMGMMGGEKKGHH